MATIKSDIQSQMRFMGPEPEPRALIGQADYMKVLNWYNYYYDNKNALPFLLTYMRNKGFPKDEIDAIKAVPDWSIQFNLMSRARMLTRGFIMFEDDIERFEQQLRQQIAKALAHVAAVKRDKVVKFPTYTKADRENEQIGEVESAIDDFLENFASDFSAYDYFRKVGIGQSRVKKYVEKLKDMAAEQNDPVFQKESSRLQPRQRRVYIKFLEKLIADCNSYTNAKKAEKTVERKPRKVKEKSADQLTKGVKFLTESPEHKLKSAAPATIIGAQEVYLFNTKNRNLHRYVAKDEKGLSVHGTKLMNVDDSQQSMKKLRKPDLVLPDVLNANKAGAKRIINGIKGTEHKGNHRIDGNMIILKVYR